MNLTRCFSRSTGLAFVLSVAAAMPAWAAGDHNMRVAQAAATSVDMTDGEVRKVDIEGGKLTLKHAEIKNLNMPGMTMVFSVKDKVMLDKLKAGDKIKFKAASEAGKVTVTEIETVK